MSLALAKDLRPLKILNPDAEGTSCLGVFFIVGVRKKEILGHQDFVYSSVPLLYQYILRFLLFSLKMNIIGKVHG